MVGKWKVFIINQYNKYYPQPLVTEEDLKDKIVQFSPDIETLVYKSAMCPPCALNGSCLKCGCDFNSMIVSDKECPDGKF